MNLQLMPYQLAVCRLAKDESIPPWAYQSSQFYSITRTTDELSIVVEQAFIPSDIKAEKHWRVFKVQGPLDFGLTGILATLISPLATAKISVFTISTFDTDYILLKKDTVAAARKIWEKEHQIVENY